MQEDGVVLVYGLHGDFRRHFSMGNVGTTGRWGGERDRVCDPVAFSRPPSTCSSPQEVLQNRVLDARIFHTEFGSGVAILTGAHRFTLSTNVGDLKLRRMPEVPGEC